MKMALVLVIVALLAGALWAGIRLTNGDKAVAANAGASAAADGNDTLAALTQACAHAVSSIRSGRGPVTVHLWTKRPDGRVLETEAEDDLRFVGDRFLLVEKTTNLTDDVTPRKDSPEAPPPAVTTTTTSYGPEQVTILEQSDSLAPSVVISAPTRGSGKDQLRQYKAFVAAVGHGADSLIPPQADLPPNTKVKGAKVVGRETIDGDECIMVDAVAALQPPEPEGGTITSTVRRWVDVDKGYTTVRMRAWREGGVYRVKTLIAESRTTVRRYGDGVWGPDRYTMEQYDLKGKLSLKLVIAYGPAFRLNVPISERDLTFTLPSGTRVRNELTDSEYTVP